MSLATPLPRSGDAAAPAHASVGALLAERGHEASDLYAQVVNPQFVRLLRTIGFDRQWARAEGSHLFDAEGRRYLDMLGGFGMFNVGRNNPRIRAALIEALELDTAGSVQLGVSPLAAFLAEGLLARAPRTLGRVLFTSSGTEAVEAALKLGRAATGRSRVLFLDHGFHGLTLGSLSVNGNADFTDRFGPLLPGFSRVHVNDLDGLEAELRREDVALFIVEPIMGKGVVIPQDGYLEGAQALCRKYGTLFVVDEVQTGLGRTGRFFALEHWGLQPDIVTVAKSLSGGYVPTSACLMSAAVYDRVFDSLENALSHGSTFAPNDLAMAAGIATLREIDEQGLVERSARLGERLLELTQPLADRFEVVDGVWGKGLMWAMGFSEPDRRKLSWRVLERVHAGLFAQLVVVPLFTDHQVLIQVAGHAQNVIKGLPPLTIEEADLEHFAASLDAVLGKAERLPKAMMSFALNAARASRRSATTA
ncbi:MAG: aspartate aminotransferase family protein [Thermoleophilia bacterium]